MRTLRLALTLALCLGPGFAWSQPEATLAELRATLDLAVSEFEGPEQGQSLLRFQAIIEQLETERREGTLSEAGVSLLATAYEYRGRVQMNLGNTQDATESFRALIALSPQHSLDEGSISPKVVDFFKAIKTQMIGYLTVQSMPQGATVSLNGRVISVTDFFPLEVVAGDYTMDVTKSGYRQESRPVTLVAGETLSLQFDLVRTTASGFVITEPTEVEILVDGVSRGSTGGMLNPSLAALAASRGLDPAKASDRLEIPDLASGSHTIEFVKPCYETLRMGLDIPEPQDYELPPIRLEPSVGSIVISSDPPGGQIFVDGKAQGVAPKTLDSVCAGLRRIEVRHAAGRFVEEVDLKPRSSVTLAAQIRPTLAFLGVIADGPSAQRSLASMTSRLTRTAAASIKGMNFLKADPAVVTKTLAAESLNLADLLPPATPDPALLRRVLERLAAALEVQGFLVGRIPEERLIRSAALHVYAAGSVVPDSASVVIEDDSSYTTFFQAFDRRVTLQAPWSGLVTVDTLLHEGPVVLRVVPGSPAEKAAFTKGHVVTQAGGRQITRTSELMDAIAATEPGKSLSITVITGEGPKTVDLPLETAPQEISLAGTGALANKISMDLRQIIEGYPGSDNAALARLNVGVIALGLHDYAGAHDAFIKAKNVLPLAPGLSRGTAAFYAGVALEHLGYAKEALVEYTQASQDAGATLFSADGPRVQDIAKRRLSALSGAR